MKLKPYHILSAAGILAIAIYGFILIFFPGKLQEKERRIYTGMNDEYYIFHRLFKDLGYEIKSWHSPNDPPNGSCLLIFDYDDQKININRLVNWIRKGNTAFIIGSIKEHLRDDVSIVTGENETLFYSNNSVQSDVTQINFRTNRFVSAKNIPNTPVLISENQRSIMNDIQYGDGSLILLADNGLLKNHSIRNENTAVFMNDLFKPFYNEKLYIYRKLKVYPNPGISSVLMDQKILILVIQFFITGLIFTLWRGLRINRPIEYKPEGRRKLQEHLWGVGNFFQKFNSFKIIYEINRAYFFYRVNQISGFQSKSSSKKRITYISHHARIPESELSELLYKESGINAKTIVKICSRMNHILNKLNKIRVK